MRVPGIAWWPGKIKAGVVNREQANAMDLFTTCLSLAGVSTPNDRVIDGVDMSPMLFGKGSSARNIQYFYRGEELFALRKGPFKAHFTTGSAYGNVVMEKHHPPLLYHLGHDPGEQYNVASQHPDVVADLVREKEKHLGELVRGKPQLYRAEQ